VKLEKAKSNLKTSLHSLESAVAKLIDKIHLLEKENSTLKVKISKLEIMHMNTGVDIADRLASMKNNKKFDGLEMLDAKTANSVDFSIKELKNMVKSK
jgi:hypothetical protein